jgi:rare lipoprotein A
MKGNTHVAVSKYSVFHNYHNLLKDENLHIKPLEASPEKKHHLPVFLILLLFIFGAISACAVRERAPLISDHERPTIVLPEIQDSTSWGPYIIDGVTYYCLSSKDGYIEEGIASWYGSDFHGKKTANGEVYDMHKKTAAHKTLPFGTHLKVVNISNGKEAIVRINDRGPFVKGRIIDLSFAAAKDIEMIGPGTAKVRIVALSRKVGTIKANGTSGILVEARNFRNGKYTVQVGAFEDENNAMRLAERLRVLFDHVTITTSVLRNEAIFYRVRVSLSEDPNEINQVVERLKYLGFSQTFIVAL